jgi:general stress protein 26
MNRQSLIQMTPDEQTEYLKHARTMILCTVDNNGYPHAVAMAFMVKDGCIYMTSFRKAQKVLNARRNPKVALLVESGRKYNELRGLMIRGNCEVIDDADEVWKIMLEVRAWQEGGATAAPTNAVIQERAKKRAVLKITPTKVSTWDHSKLPPDTY